MADPNPKPESTQSSGIPGLKSPVWLGVLVLAGLGLWYVARSDAKPPKGTSAAPSNTETSPSAPSGEGTTPAQGTVAKPMPPSASTAFLDFGYGTKDGQLGRDKPTEGNPEGPMSFAVAKDGMYVLDQVNERVLRVDAKGKITGRFAASRTTQDVAVAKDGTVAMFDRHGKKSVSLFDPTGRPIGELPIAGPGIAQTGTSTGVFIDGKEVYAEREHGALIHLGSIDGTVGDRKELSGRPSKDGTYLAGAWRAPEAARGFLYSAFDRAKNQLRFNRSHVPSFPVAQIALLDTDLRGRMYVGVQAEDANGAPKSEVSVYCFDGQDGKPSGRATYRVSEIADESFKDAVVTDDGDIVYQYRDEAGVHFAQTRCSN